jgi:outer membrane protein assembly factor BamE (lipoprotein component of BamABCDE complex)
MLLRLLLLASLLVHTHATMPRPRHRGGFGEWKEMGRVLSLLVWEGMTEGQVRLVLGPPTGWNPFSPTFGVGPLFYDDYELTISFDDRGRVSRKFFYGDP